MKKALGLLATTIALSIGATAASATNISLCSLPYQKLKANGYKGEKMPNTLYNANQIMKFMKVVNVEPENLNQLKPYGTYEVHYECFRDTGGVIHPSLIMVEKPTPAGMITSNFIKVSWELTAGRLVY